MTVRSEFLRGRSAAGMTLRELAAITGISTSNLCRIAHGSMPTAETARLVAEALDRPGILERAIAARTKVCEVCGASFVDGGRNNTARCCRLECQRTRHQRKVRNVESLSLRGRAEVAENRLELYQSAVERFCLECEPEGMCRDRACGLRPVSPLPLAVRRAA